MNILIITTFFPPDSTIASVRPYLFAKHLSEAGEKVTVLRTGFFDMPPYDEYTDFSGFEVISALGGSCDAEKFRRGEYEGFRAEPKRKLSSLPRRVRLPIKAVRDGMVILRGKPPRCIRMSGTMLKYQKRAIDRLYGSGRHYDVVFATCGDCENIYAGRYAAEKFGAKWIMDFRDPMIKLGGQYDDFWWNKFAKDATVLALKRADAVTAVSEGLAEDLRRVCHTDKIEVLYNGFDDCSDMPSAVTESGVLSFCYTGRLYDDSIPVLKDFASALANLISKGAVDRDKVRYFYAGSSSDDAKKIFGKEGISDVLVDCGYLSKSETLELQISTDVFTVIAWNTPVIKGVLTGKFYEGIHVRKPILSLVSGKEPKSELFELQKKYGYGFCYEQCSRKTSLKELEAFIERLYAEKIANGEIAYRPSQELYNTFCYSALSRKLSGIMTKLTTPLRI